ncbi:hypothetical protein Zmor_008192 [Zophobas morio]|uniref:Uncharacterized protein n=1 Tax=Zophobas morio TaxID=2755281 RepID=A0AA38MQF7_9CUCU|nr:hypothetical protein Zmor_008192 [Zophobas morio]
MKHFPISSEIDFSSKLTFGMIGANCVVCLYSGNFDLCHIFSLFKRQCRHSKHNCSPIPTLRISTTVLIFHLIFFTCLLIPALVRLPFILEMCSVKITLCIILLSDETFLMDASILALMATFKLKTIVKELQTWSNIVDCRAFFGLNDIFDSKKARRIVLVKSVFTLGVFGVVLLLTVLYFFGVGYDNLPWNVPNKVATLIAMVIFCYIYMEFCLRIAILGAILASVKKALKTSTQKNIKLFAKHAHIIRAISLNHDRIINLIAMLLIVWFLANIVFLILNICALLDYNTYNMFTFLILHSRTIGSVAGIVLLLYFHDYQVKQKVSSPDI